MTTSLLLKSQKEHDDYVSRMDRVYLSKELLTEDYCTNTFYIGIYWITKKSMFLSCLEQSATSATADHGGAHKLCVMELVKGADEMTMAVEQR